MKPFAIVLSKGEMGKRNGGVSLNSVQGKHIKKCHNESLCTTNVC
jgi:hypothetical protein